MRIGFKIQTMFEAALDETASYARCRFSASEEEMRWHLSYFGFLKGIVAVNPL
jgi:hypothetical protein